MPTNSFSEKDLTLLFRMIDSRLAGLYTIEVGTVEAYDPATGLATVQLGLERRKGNGGKISPATIPRVPAWRWQVGAFYAHVPYKKGDTVLVGFVDRDASAWFESGGIQTPAPKRAFDVNDAVILQPLATSDSLEESAPRDANNATFGTLEGEVEVTVTPGGDISMLGAGDMVLGAKTALGARVELGGGKVAIGTSAVELLDQISQDISKSASMALQLSTATTATAIGTQPLSVAAQLVTIQTQLLALKAKVELIKK